MFVSSYFLIKALSSFNLEEFFSHVDLKLSNFDFIYFVCLAAGVSISTPICESNKPLLDSLLFSSANISAYEPDLKAL